MNQQVDQLATGTGEGKLNWQGYLARAALIFFVAMFVYIPAMQSKWIWDDNLLITEFPPMQHRDGIAIFWYPWKIAKHVPWLEKVFPWTAEPTYKGLGDLVPDYYPITWSTLWLEWHYWKDFPQAYHVVNCLLHAISAVILWRVLAKLRIPGAMLGGLVFAVHPVNVCSVAWVSELKNVYSINFFLLTLLFYFGYDMTRSWWRYVLALLMFVLALLSKASVVTLPVVLMLGAWWRRAGGQVAPWTGLDRAAAYCLNLPGRIPGIGQAFQWLRIDRLRFLLADLVRTAPFFVLAAGASWLIVQTQISSVIRGESIFEPGEGTKWWRLAMAGSVPWFYIYKDLLPINLLMIYPRWDIVANVVTGVYHWQIDPALLTWALPPFCMPVVPIVATRTGWAFHPEALWDLRGAVALLIAGAVLLALRRRAWARNLLFMLGYFVVLLLPVMGFFDMYFIVHSLVADHWQHLSLIGVVALVAGAGTWLFTRRGRDGERILGRWRIVAESPSLAGLRRLLADRPGQLARWFGIGLATVVVTVLGVLTWNQTLVYEDQVALWGYNLPYNPEAWMGQYNMGTTLAERAGGITDPSTRTAKLEEALGYLVAATKLKRDSAANNNAGLTLMNLGRHDESVQYLKRAVEFSREGKNPQACLNLSMVYRDKGDLDEALRWIAKAEEAQRVPEVLLVHAQLLVAANRPQEALEKCDESLKMVPRHVQAIYQRGLIYRMMGQLDNADADFRRALDLQPNASPAMYQMGLLAEQRGRRDEAIDWCTRAVVEAAGYVEARYKLGLLLSEAGRPREAVAHLSVVAGVTPDSAEVRANLAGAMYRSGFVADAMAQYRKAIELKENYIAPMSDLARILAHPQSGQFRNIPEAVALAEKSCILTDYKDPGSLEGLAIVYAEAGRFPDAVRVEKRLLDLVGNTADEGMVKLIKSRIQLFESGRPVSSVANRP